MKVFLHPLERAIALIEQGKRTKAQKLLEALESVLKVVE